MTLPTSPSDYRSAKNNRAELRRILRADGLLKNEQSLEKPAEITIPVTPPSLLIEGGVVMANSLDVATHFGKSHKDVLRSIDRLLTELDAVFAGRNFTPSAYIDSTGKSNRCFKLTRDALSLIAMGFTGGQAIKWKQAYIEAFNAMEAELLQVAAPPALTAKIKALEADLAALIDLVADSQKQMLALPAPQPNRPKIKPLPRWMKKQYERRARRTAA